MRYNIHVQNHVQPKNKKLNMLKSCKIVKTKNFVSGVFYYYYFIYCNVLPTEPSFQRVWFKAKVLPFGINVLKSNSK